MPSVRWEGPRRSVEGLADVRGRAGVVGGCLDLLAGREVDGGFVLALGGPPARWAVQGGAPGPDYWLRVWALRGLLWLWDDRATSAVVGALDDDAWRVREMGLKVVARHRLDAALPAVALRQQDPVARVRQAAQRALVRLSSDTDRVRKAPNAALVHGR